MARRRLVPKSAVPCLETRAALYFEDGAAMIDYDIDDPDAPMHEVLGVMAYAMIVMMLDHLESAE